MSLCTKYMTRTNRLGKLMSIILASAGWNTIRVRHCRMSSRPPKIFGDKRKVGRKVIALHRRRPGWDAENAHHTLSTPSPKRDSLRIRHCTLETIESGPVNCVQYIARVPIPWYLQLGQTLLTQQSGPGMLPCSSLRERKKKKIPTDLASL